MTDILGRELKIGDLIITDTSSKNECSLTRNSLCIVTGDKRAFGGKRDFKHGPAYLIEIPSEADLLIKANLEAEYNEYIQAKMRKVEVDRERARKRNEEFKNSVKPVVGDILLNGSYYVLYLGICRFEEKGETREGHTYLQIPNIVHHRYNTRYYEEIEKQSDRWLSMINKKVPLSLLNVLNYNLNSYDRGKLSENSADLYIKNYKDIFISKSYSRKFSDIMYHVNLSDWNLGTSVSLLFSKSESMYRSNLSTAVLTNMNK